MVTNPPSTWQLIREDWRDRSTLKCLLLCVLGLTTLHAVFLYRIAHALHGRRIPVLPTLLREWNIARHGCDIDPRATFGGGLQINHGVGLVVGGEVIAGRNCLLLQNVTLGSRGRERNGRVEPTLGDDVCINAGAMVLGGITVGDRANIGAGAVVLTDVPADGVMVGNPARPLGEKRAAK